LPLFDMGMEDTAYPFLLFLSQAETEQVLVEHLAEPGVAVCWNTRVTGHWADDGASILCELVDVNGRKQQVGARYLVGCDGAHSSVREGAGIRFAGGRYPQTFLLADAEADGLDAGAAHVWFGSTGPVVLLPVHATGCLAAPHLARERPGRDRCGSSGRGECRGRSGGARGTADGRRRRDRRHGAARDSGVVDSV
jgi:2-polyprenyl-6-methoxyphenol hydroxylase-like FAD-dependent oxidoreductase